MLRTIAASTLAFVLCFSAGEASARDSLQSACPQVFADGRPPAIGRHAENRLLCFRAYALMHSARTRTAVWSAEHLTRAAVDAARDLPRDSDFYEEPRLARNERASLNDYGRGAGFDRGHLAPSAILATRHPRRRASAWRTSSHSTRSPTGAHGATSRHRPGAWCARSAPPTWSPALRLSGTPARCEAVFRSRTSCGRPSTCPGWAPRPTSRAMTRPRLTASRASRSWLTSSAWTRFRRCRRPCA
ncbi:exported protein of unknown function (plasmid) [Cupriavidus taiwanensis]|uniref:Endonuclease n=1 Tax=Cupriavidus taiwanensis TaxID=164546 RepID=A0A375EDG4_9BURK|nr:exported hypothetical protein [Cupriavidus taiwanensis]SOZ75160.1 exported hypothetical protein [Cupriavidus taiwanensis]SPA03731.1 exported protein of unknown function [Cupriavidus taiwanensis]SPA11635.1 exported protein of unknown function [Cupriavidus taiwanensis]